MFSSKTKEKELKKDNSDLQKFYCFFKKHTSKIDTLIFTIFLTATLLAYAKTAIEQFITNTDTNSTFCKFYSGLGVSRNKYWRSLKPLYRTYFQSFLQTS